MKKIIVLLLSFMFLTSISACTESPDKLYGYWKNERNYKLMVNKNSINYKGRLYENIIFKKNDDIWITNEVYNFLGASGSYGFKIIDDNTIELFEYIGNSVKSLGNYSKISKEDYEAKEESQDPPLKDFPSLF